MRSAPVNRPPKGHQARSRIQHRARPQRHALPVGLGAAARDPRRVDRGRVDHRKGGKTGNQSVKDRIPQTKAKKPLDAEGVASADHRSMHGRRGSRQGDVGAEGNIRKVILFPDCPDRAVDRRTVDRGRGPCHLEGTESSCAPNGSVQGNGTCPSIDYQALETSRPVNRGGGTREGDRTTRRC